MKDIAVDSETVCLWLVDHSYDRAIYCYKNSVLTIQYWKNHYGFIIFSFCIIVMIRGCDLLLNLFFGDWQYCT